MRNAIAEWGVGVRAEGDQPEFVEEGLLEGSVHVAGPGIPPRAAAAADRVTHTLLRRTIGPHFLRTFEFEGRKGTAPLRTAMMILAKLDGDWWTPFPDGVPLGHIKRQWQRHAIKDDKIDRTHWELATYSALAGTLAAGDIWRTSRRKYAKHR